jgi:predicted small secreted protein
VGFDEPNLVVVVMKRRCAVLTMLAAVLLASCGDTGRGPGSNVQSSATPTSTQIAAPVPEATARPIETAVPRSDAKRLQVCIDVSPGAQPSLSAGEALDLARAGLPAYGQLYQLSSDMMKEAGGEALEPMVLPLIEFGCPDGYILRRAGVGEAVKALPVVTPSPYHLHIFVATDAEIAASFPAGEKFYRQVYEWQRFGMHTLAEVTTALYVPLSQMRDPSTVGWVFADGTGITPILRYPCGHPDPAPKCQGIRP